MRPPIDLKPFEWYIRISFYLFLVMWPFVGMAFATSLQRWEPVQFLVVGVCGTIVAALSIVVAHGGINRLGRAVAAGARPSLRPAPPLAMAWLVSVVVMIGVIVWWALVNDTFPTLLLGAFLVSQAAALIPVLSNRDCAITFAVLAVVFLALCVANPGPWEMRMVVALWGLMAGVFVTVTAWLTVWMLRVMWELDASRALAGQLAVAEERLRISRDLHDVFGRTLATISVKSTLAGELARRGRGEEAAAELDEIRRISDAAGRETRAVVRGERGVDLEAELRGARAVLESAGVECDLVRADDAPLPPRLTEPLAWVTREAVTNILRHSRASRAEIVLGTSPPRLTITNDHPLQGTGGSGTGLESMAHRLAPAGGRLFSTHTPDEFTLVAEFGDPR